MFALRYDDFKRKVAALDPPIELHKLTTCFVNTPEYESYLGAFLDEANESIYIEIEDDNRTVTFFTINPTQRTKELLNG